MLDLRGIFTIVKSVEVKIGQYSHPIFEFIHKEWERVSAATDMPEEEQHNRRAELMEIKSLSQPYRNKDALPAFRESYVARLKSGKNYYSQRPLHWDSSTVK